MKRIFILLITSSYVLSGCSGYHSKFPTKPQKGKWNISLTRTIEEIKNGEMNELYADRKRTKRGRRRSNNQTQEADIPMNNGMEYAYIPSASSDKHNEWWKIER